MIFRYPGGKGKLVKKFIGHIPFTSDFADVFVGGGSVALAVAARKGNEKTKIHLNDLDQWISSFWSVIVGEEKSFKTLISKVEYTEITIDEFTKRRKDFSPQDFSKRGNANLTEAAFNALFFNRTTFSGCLGSGPIGGYETQETADWKVDARWNSKRLIKEITEARKLLLGRTKVTNCDFSAAIKGLPQQCFIYADPPYFHKGDSIYESGFLTKRHDDLFQLLSQRENWLLSYDNCLEIQNLYINYKQEPLGKRSHSMSISTENERPVGDTELIIFSKEIFMKCDLKNPHEKHDGCDGRKKWAKGYAPKKEKINKGIAPLPSLTSRNFFDVLTPEQVKSLVQFGKCEITQAQVQEVSK